MRESSVQMARAKAAAIAPMVSSPALSGQRFRNGRMTRAMTANDPSGSSNMAQTAAAVTITAASAYSFLKISSATCSRPLGT